MIDHSRYRFFLIVSLVLAVLSFGMFTYQHFFYEANKLKDTTTVYISKTTIPAFEEADTSQFQAVSIPKKGLVNGMIQNLTEIEGKFLLHGLQPGEILVQSQLSDEALNQEGNLLIPLTGTHMSDIRPLDIASIYVLVQVQNPELKTSTFKVAKLFSAKKIHSNGRLASVNQVVEGEDVQFYIKLTEEEMNAYYQALKTGELIVAKNMEEVHAVVENLTGFDLNQYQNALDSDEFIDIATGIQNPSLIEDEANYSEDDAERGTVRYRVGEDETWETISIKFKTDKETLYLLNPDVVNIEEGIEIFTPSI